MASRDPKNLGPANLQDKFQALLVRRDWNKLLYLLRDMNESKPVDTLDGDRTYYVDVTLGNDGNDGRSPGAGGAFKTIAFAFSLLPSIVQGPYTITVQLAAGTYDESLELFGADWTNQNYWNVILKGDTADPASRILTGYYQGLTTYNAKMTIIGIKVQNSYSYTSYGGGIVHNGGETLTQNVHFGPCGWTCFGIYGGQHYSSSITVAHAQVRIVHGVFGGRFASTGGLVIAVPLTSIDHFANVEWAGYLYSSATISGAGVAGSTGARYNINHGGSIRTDGAGESYFPGDTAGEIGGAVVTIPTVSATPTQAEVEAVRDYAAQLSHGSYN